MTLAVPASERTATLPVAAGRCLLVPRFEGDGLVSGLWGPLHFLLCHGVLFPLDRDRGGLLRQHGSTRLPRETHHVGAPSQQRLHLAPEPGNGSGVSGVSGPQDFVRRRFALEQNDVPRDLGDDARNADYRVDRVCLLGHGKLAQREPRLELLLVRGRRAHGVDIHVTDFHAGL